jgi:hypothetical protein
MMSSTTRLSLLLVMTTMMMMLVLMSTTMCVRAATTPDDQCDEVVAGADRRPNKQRLKVVSFNLYWLFLEDWMTGIKPGMCC